MSSRIFKARTTHSDSSPQICGLHASSLCAANIDGKEVPGGIVADQECYFLTCQGDQANPAAQIQRSSKKDGYATGFRTIPSGRYKEYKDRRGIIHRKPIFKWQEQGPNGRWHDVKVWEKMVHTSCAAKLGYFVSQSHTVAFRGNRTKGHAHSVNANPISGLEELAAAEFEAEQEEKANGDQE